MTTKTSSIILALLASLLAGAAHVFFKLASEDITFSIFTLLDLDFITGLVLLAMGAVLFIISLKNGELTVLYPMISASYVWAVIASHFIFPSDSLTIFKSLGIVVIFIGMYFIGRGMEHKAEAI